MHLFNSVLQLWLNRGMEVGLRKGEGTNFPEHSLGVGLTLSTCLIHPDPCEADIAFW